MQSVTDEKNNDECNNTQKSTSAANSNNDDAASAPIIPPTAASKNQQLQQQQQQQQKIDSSNGNDGDDNSTDASSSRNCSNNQSISQQEQQQKVLSNASNNSGYGRRVNTESFDPSHKPPDMRVVVDLGKEKLTTKLTVRDVLLCPNLFSQPGDDTIYERLISEMDKCTIPMKLWHGDSHMMADDRTGFATQCPTFQMVIARIAAFFSMKIVSTRYNFFRGTDDWKPFHHDAAQCLPALAKVQNITVGVSFGTTRDADFEEVESKKVVRFPLVDGAVYVFCRDLNCMWRHGIPQVPPEKQTKRGRISIIAWGWVDQLEYHELDI